MPTYIYIPKTTSYLDVLKFLIQTCGVKATITYEVKTTVDAPPHSIIYLFNPFSSFLGDWKDIIEDKIVFFREVK